MCDVLDWIIGNDDAPSEWKKVAMAGRIAMVSIASAERGHRVTFIIKLLGGIY